jgi:surface carbohydrate biosynthesis protein
MSFPKTAALIVDHPRRDLAGMLYIANGLLKEFKKVYLIPFYHDYEIFLNKPDVVIYTDLRKKNHFLLKKLKKSGCKVVILDNEGVMFGSIKKNNQIIDMIKLLVNHENLYDKYMLWGSDLKKIVLEQITKSNHNILKKIVVSGHPRFDLFKFKFKKKSFKKKTILINTSFPAVNSLYSTKNEMVNILAKSSHDNNIYYSKKKVTRDNKIFLNFIKQLKKIIESFQNHKVIINPHPFENYNFYKELFGNSKNVIILRNNFDLSALIKSSNFVLSYNCQTAVESFLANKITHSLNFIDKSNILPTVYNKITFPVTSFFLLKKIINEKIYFSRTQVLAMRSLLFKYFQNAKSNSLSIFLKEINKLNKFSDKGLKNIDKNFYCYFFSQGVRFFYLINVLKYLLVILFGSKNFFLLKTFIFQNYKEKYFSIKKIIRIKNKYNLSFIKNVSYSIGKVSLFKKKLITIEISS